MRESRFLGIYIGVAIIVAVWGLSVLGVFNLPNYMAYDFFTRWSSSQERSTSKCLLITANFTEANADDSVWLNVLDQLEAMGAKQVVFSFMPGGVSSEFYKRAMQKGQVLFGRQRVRQSLTTGTPEFDSIPKQAQGLDLRIGLQDIPPSAYGIHRFAQAYWILSGKRYDHVIMTAAEARLASKIEVDQLFAVNFLGGGAGIPNTDLKSLLSGNIISELVREKTVLIGFQVPEFFPDLKTPLTPTRPGISPLQFDGYSFDTLVSRKPIRWPGPLATLLLLFVLVILGLVAYQVLSPASAVLFALLMVVVSMGLAWILLWRFLYWLPLVEIIAVQGILLSALITMRARLADLESQQIILEKSTKAESRFVPESFFRSDEHWSQVIRMVDQTLSIKRSIFFERIEEQHRVREIVALNTSLSEIEEKRRDFWRDPYTSALAQGVPIRVSRFFKSTPESQQDYLVPLSFSGQVFGVWAFTIERQDTLEETPLLLAVQKFAVNIGELLYRRKAWIRQESMQRHPLRQFLSLKTSQHHLQKIADFLGLLELRLSLFESTFDSLRSPALLSDIFGRVIIVNTPMSKLAKAVSLDPYQMTALDVVVAFSGKDPNEIRSSLSKVILNEETVEFPVSFSVDRLEAYFRLSIKPVKSDERVQFLGPGLPLNLYGLLIQLRDVSKSYDLVSAKDRFMAHGAEHIRKGIGSIVNACSSIEGFEGVSGNREDLLANLVNNKTALEASLDELESFIEVNVISETVEYFPLDTKEYLDLALISLKDEAEKKHLTFQIEGSSIPTWVLAMPQELSDLFHVILLTLIKDSYESACISIEIREEDLRFSYVFSNSGYGMPDQDFQQLLSGSVGSNSKEFERLSRLRSPIDKWKGILSGSSSVGEGMKFTVSLGKVFLSSSN